MRHIGIVTHSVPGSAQCFQAVAQHGQQVLGTRWTMEAELYPRELAAHGLRCQVPSAQDREGIQRITFEQLVNGLFTDAARQRAQRTAVTKAWNACGGRTRTGRASSGTAACLVSRMPTRSGQCRTSTQAFSSWWV
ncbi:Asp/Glu/Hydantoin racemase [Haloechinothrix alba]|uniref:Asp/Glu/Hydantoin racemase n=1 Tax=Haloechinothrix alba TaxID=664784 RepID=A0A238WDT5_9PSEU|nr:Asp/Glu/Hydantoin racemase [Haloechinothrix alba]